MASTADDVSETGAETASCTNSEPVGNFSEDLKFHIGNKDMETVSKYVTTFDVLMKEYPEMKLCDQRTIDSAKKMVEKWTAASERENGRRKRGVTTLLTSESTVTSEPDTGSSTANDGANHHGKKRKKIKKSGDVDGDDGECGQVTDDNEWICTICSQLKSSDGTDLLLCDGGCKRSFHTGCLGVSSVFPEGDWICDQCINNTHSCFICNEENSVENPVKKCQSKKCGKYYHRRCVTDNFKHYTEKTFVKAKGKTVDKASLIAEADTSIGGSPSRRVRKTPAKYSDSVTTAVEEVGEEEEEDYNLLCPAHFCDVCYDIYGKQQKQLLHKCLCCPKAFHANCILPGSRYNSMCLICPDHPDKPLPSLDEADTDADIEFEMSPSAATVSAGRVSLGHRATDPNNIWDQIAFFGAEPDARNLFDTHFLLPVTLKTEVEQQRPVYKELSKLDFDSFPGGEKAIPFHQTHEVCDCATKPGVIVDGVEVKKCGPDCLNKILQIECYDNKSKARNPNDSSCGNCSLGGDCGNRQIQQRKYAKVQPFMEFERGWGLKVIEPVAKGQLVIEYIGEVINQETTTKRMADQRKFTPNDHDFYIMQLENGVFVDGKFKGNHSRFINHSCDPNCELVPTLVRGRMRIGIFAIKDIPNDAPLSYDYAFETSEAQAFKCCCGSANCRGTMAPISKNERDRERYLSLTKSKKIDKMDRKRMIEVR